MPDATVSVAGEKFLPRPAPCGKMTVAVETDAVVVVVELPTDEETVELASASEVLAVPVIVVLSAVEPTAVTAVVFVKMDTAEEAEAADVVVALFGLLLGGWRIR